MIELYPHQAEFVGQLRAALRTHRAVIAQASTGFGKTILAAYMVKEAAGRGRRVLFTVHRRDLLHQTAATFDAFNIPYGVIAAGITSNPTAAVQIASMPTLQGRLEGAGDFDLVVADEAHLSAAAGQKRVVLHYKGRGACIVGLTATPGRLSGEGLGDIYETIVHGPAMEWLIEKGHLSRYRLYAPSVPDLSNVHSRMGDYVADELEATMSGKGIVGNAITHYRRLAPDYRALAFCVSRRHSEHVAEQFRAAGIPAVHIDGETPRAERLVAFRALAKGKINVITSVAIFCEGFDLSAQVQADVTIEAVILLRPTMSLNLYLQQVGRALRKKDFPAVILDHSGNSLRHGLPDTPRTWTLEGLKRKGRRPDANAEECPIRQCPACFRVHRPTPICPECGHVYEIKARMPDEQDGDLTEVDLDAARRAAKWEQGKAQTIEDLVAIGRKRKYRNPRAWAFYVMRARRGKNANNDRTNR